MRKSLFGRSTAIAVVALFSPSMLQAQTTPSYWTKGSLEQNKPNPFNKNITIRYSIPQGSKGQINIYDQSGKLVKAFNANESGRSELSGYDLTSGTYTYTLMINGKVALSKQMLIIK